MSKRHLKTRNAPKSWPIERKNKFWITRSNPGPHNFQNSLPLGVIFSDMLKYIDTKRELKKILNQKMVKVNGEIRIDKKFPVGILDVISFPEKENYRLFYNQIGKFTLEKISDKEKDFVLFKVKDKKILKNNKIQLSFTNGRTLLVGNEKISTGDSIQVVDKKIKEIIQFEKGSIIYLTGGKHIGIFGKVKEIKANKVIFIKDKEELETLKKYAFVVGRDKSIITLK